MRSHDSSEMSVNGSKRSMPALVTMISTGPSSARTRRERGVDRGPVADVDRHGDRRRAARLQVLRALLGGVAVEIEHRDPATLPSEAPADRRPHPARDHGHPHAARPPALELRVT